jgi:hemoglobin
MEKQKQIIALDDIKLLVDSFYGKVRKDELLAPIFNERIGNKWPEHLEKMYRFWQTVLLGEHTYYGSPFTPHANLPVNKEHFNRWLKLFNATINEQFTGEKAEEARWRAGKMAEMFHHKIEYYKNNPEKPIL